LGTVRDVFAIEHQHVGGAVGGKAWIGASTVGFYNHVRPQIFAPQINGGRFAILKRFGFYPCNGGLKTSAATATGKQKCKGEA
jgi:hypothetical protein